MSVTTFERPARLRRAYPDDWDALVVRTRERANYTCETCGARHGEPHPEQGYIVYLATAHMNHDTSDSRAENLRALCPTCHGRYDAVQHAQTRRERYGHLMKPEGWWAKPITTRKTAPRWRSGPLEREEA